MNYPSRKGWNVPEPDSPYLLKRHGIEVQSDHEVGSFLQTWLYFGLLFEITKERVDTSVFEVMTSANAHHFSSVHLSRVISEWSVKALQPPRRRHRRQQVNNLEGWVAECYSILKYADKILDRIAHAYEERQNSNISLIGLSIAALGDYLGQTVASIAVQKGYYDDEFPVWTLQESLCQPIREKMQHFCPNRVHSFVSNGITAGVLWYVANLEPPQVQDHHTACSIERCNSLHVDQNEYIVKHSDENCFCDFKELESSHLHRVVEDGAIALFTAHEICGQMRLTLHDQRITQQYVAISHVWADGHGNMNSNAFPSCFLRKLQDEVDALGLTPGASTPIWMDTMCLPRYPLHLRRKAVSRLSEIFQRATGILVMDSYLQTLTCSNVSPLEVLARVSLSGWTARLWTFSEGQLARKIWLQFSDTAIDLHCYVSVWREDLRGRQIPSMPDINVAYQMTNLYTATTLVPESEGEEELLQLSQIKAALTSRHTSWQSDEALCLGAILKLDLSKIIAADDEHKMAAFWRQMPEAYLPVDLIFTKFSPKLELVGLRWAPATLLSGSNHGLTALPMYNFALYAMPTERGLQIETPTMMFDAVGSDASPISERNFIQICCNIHEHDPRDWDFLLQDQNGTWYTCFVTDRWHQINQDFIDDDEVPCILLRVEESDTSNNDLFIDEEDDEAEAGDEQERIGHLGVFASYHPSTGPEEIPCARALTHVGVNQVPPEHWAYFDEAAKCASAYRNNHRELQVEDDIDENFAHVKSWVAKYPSLPELLQLQQNAATDDHATFLEQLAECVVHFCYVGEYYKVTLGDESRTWCVD